MTKPLHSRTIASSTSIERARDLRRDATPPERALWSKLRRKQLGGFRFRRQHPIGPYIADFYCHEIGVVVEIDGSHHENEQKQHDERRDAWMRERGLLVLRFTGSDVNSRMNDVLSEILRRCRERV